MQSAENHNASREKIIRKPLNSELLPKSHRRLLCRSLLPRSELKVSRSSISVLPLIIFFFASSLGPRTAARVITFHFNGRPNRRKPLGEFKSKLHVGLC